MDVRLTIPDEIAAQLQPNGEDLARRALEALAIEGYRTEELSLGQVAEMLSLSISEADGFLKERRIPMLLTLEDFNRDSVALEQVLSK